MKINLIKNGIFPITKDEHNKKIIDDLDTGFLVSGTIQGEGIYSGVPSLFLRTSGCNLRCLFTSKDKKHNFCDTYYSSFRPEINLLDINVVEKIIRNNIGNIKHLVITGGEPLLQVRPIIELLKKIKDLKLLVTIETNGTIFNSELNKYVHLYSVSPKLSNSIPTEEKLKDINNYLTNVLIEQHKREMYDLIALKEYAKLGYKNKVKVQFKFVVTCREDIIEIKENYLWIHKDQSWLSSTFLLMPEGLIEEELKEKSNWVIEECIVNNFRFCPRLHIETFGGKKRYV